jgi:hypothetical protein
MLGVSILPALWPLFPHPLWAARRVRYATPAGWTITTPAGTLTL